VTDGRTDGPTDGQNCDGYAGVKTLLENILSQLSLNVSVLPRSRSRTSKTNKICFHERDTVSEANKKSPANANGNAQQPRCMFESPVKQSKSVARGRQTTGGYSVLLVLTSGRDVSRSANAVSAGYRKFSLPPLI